MKKQETKKEKKHFLKHLIIILLIIIILSATLFTISFLNWKNLAITMITNTPSIVLDSNGNEIASIGSSRITENVKFEDIPNNLKNAYVAIEDQRYYRHFGIDIKRTTAAIASYIINLGNATFGGSSITQQLVKNLTGNTANNIPRKIAE